MNQKTDAPETEEVEVEENLETEVEVEVDAKAKADGEDDLPELTEEEQEAELNAAFESAFTGVVEPAKADEKPAEIDNSATDLDEAGKAASEEDAAEEPAIVLAGYTEEEIKTLLSMASKFGELSDRLSTSEDKMHGRYGELNRSIKEIKDNPAKGAGLKITPETLKRLSAEFPEVATLMAEDLNEVFQAGGGGNEIDFDARLEPHIEKITANMDRRLEGRLLAHYRPNWLEEQKSEEFTSFKESLDDKDLETYVTSWNADEINGYFTRFDKWKGEQAALAQAESEKAAKKLAAQAGKKKRLDAAMVPRGSTAEHSPSEDDALEAGFQSVRGATL